MEIQVLLDVTQNLPLEQSHHRGAGDADRDDDGGDGDAQEAQAQRVPFHGDGLSMM